MTQAAHERDYQRRYEAGETRFLPGTRIEVIHEVDMQQPPQYALFDFDGTLSLIREGWPEVMVPMMVDIMRNACATDESDEALYELCMNFVMELNGKQTIYQMIRLGEEIEKRGGTPADPLEYKNRYLDLLLERIDARRNALRNGSADPRDMLVPGSLELLQALQERGVTLYLASGTDERFVIEEANLLGLGELFGEHIYGAQDDYKAFSKQLVIERLLQANHVDPARLLGFGDGYVEIDNVKASGGTAIAVASDEANRSGEPDPWKRDRLIGVGADLVIADFREYQSLLDYLWP